MAQTSIPSGSSVAVKVTSAGQGRRYGPEKTPGKSMKKSRPYEPKAKVGRVRDSQGKMKKGRRYGPETPDELAEHDRFPAHRYDLKTMDETQLRQHAIARHGKWFPDDHKQEDILRELTLMEDKSGAARYAGSV